MIRLCDRPFDPWKELQAYQETLCANPEGFGATASFVGTMRDFNEGDSVDSMTLEHYPGMTEKQLETIVAEARRRWRVLGTLIIHRIGTIVPKDPIVLTAAWSIHRGDAFDACRYMMEELKSSAPFWKKEALDGGRRRWVERNTDGYTQGPA